MVRVGKSIISEALASIAEKPSTPSEADKKTVSTRKVAAVAGRHASKTRRVRWVKSDEPHNGRGVHFQVCRIMRNRRGLNI
jgi:hypothetical protein